MKLLVADDEYEIANALKEVLERNKYTVDMVLNGDDAFEYAKASYYDAIILDIMMPGTDGITVTKNLRKCGVKTPILLLTALSSLDDKVVGLDAGADDYLAKPFAFNELLARVRALLRRSESYTSDILTFGNLKLDCGTYELSTPAKNAKMSNKEFQLMEHFMRNPKTVFSTESLMERFWGWDSDAEINVVWTNIGYLRRKLSDMDADVQIKSIRGLGYQLDNKQ